MFRSFSANNYQRQLVVDPDEDDDFLHLIMVRLMKL